MKDLDDNLTMISTETQPLVQILEEKQEEARRELQRLVDRLSLPEHATLFDELNRAILNLWDISHAIDKRLSKLTGKPVFQPPPATSTNNNNLNNLHIFNNVANLVDLRENILKAISEQHLAKTILVYVGALEARTHMNKAAERANSKKWDEQYQKGVQLGDFTKYLE